MVPRTAGVDSMAGTAHVADLQRLSRRLHGSWLCTGVELWVFWPHTRLLKAGRATQHVATVSSLFNTTVAILPLYHPHLPNLVWSSQQDDDLPTSPFSAIHALQEERFVQSGLTKRGGRW